ncbi:hypothetical protein K505DRAFT_359938 [Melanomma pulvis-pyrius CBS 109.77]|uniref:Uncharacterized protein n=1 Tax=Melanomma pulvis-pyrius CBS 109.77 TaxID=1314802 RepID=A0A6A6XIJ4_9PLEO|nr:hypothetical protein K505DRAFT_359938 [Melanomma pulvis-pyrius CBS 109.77]
MTGLSPSGTRSPSNFTPTNIAEPKPDPETEFTKRGMGFGLWANIIENYASQIEDIDESSGSKPSFTIWPAFLYNCMWMLEHSLQRAGRTIEIRHRHTLHVLFCSTWVNSCESPVQRPKNSDTSEIRPEPPS